MNYEKNIEEINKEIFNPKEKFDTLKGFENVLENMVYQVYDIFGRNALLSMLYTIGKGPGDELAEEILKEQGKSIINDPYEAFTLILKKTEDYYSVKVKDIKIENHNQEFDKIVITIQNRCFYRESIQKSDRIKIGKALCRINKGFFESACKKLTGFKCDIDFIENDEENDACIESLVLQIPKSQR